MNINSMVLKATKLYSYPFYKQMSTCKKNHMKIYYHVSFLYCPSKKSTGVQLYL